MAGKLAGMAAAAVVAAGWVAWSVSGSPGGPETVTATSKTDVAPVTEVVDERAAHQDGMFLLSIPGGMAGDVSARRPPEGKAFWADDGSPAEVVQRGVTAGGGERLLTLPDKE